MGLAALVAVASVIAGCGTDSSGDNADGGDRTTIVVTYSVLGSLVSDAVGDNADVVVLTNLHDKHNEARSVEVGAGCST